MKTKFCRVKDNHAFICPKTNIIYRKKGNVGKIGENPTDFNFSNHSIVYIFDGDVSCDLVNCNFSEIKIGECFSYYGSKVFTPAIKLSETSVVTKKEEYFTFKADRFVEKIVPLNKEQIKNRLDKILDGHYSSYIPEKYLIESVRYLSEKRFHCFKVARYDNEVLCIEGYKK